MAVYHKDHPGYFDLSIQSMLNQSVKSDDFVIICDGPLNDQLNQIIDKYVFSNPEINVIRLEKNVGLGNALNHALPYCKNELVARMDSDDISHLNRCEQQLKCFHEHPEYSIIGGTINEFDMEYQDHLSTRKLPEFHEDIVTFSKKRNPFNHPSVMFKKSAVMDAGNYQPFHLYEDYYLWIRMLLKGYKGYNIQSVLLDMRAGIEMIRRRGGYSYFKAGKKFQKYLLTQKHIGKYQYLKNIVIRFVSQVLLPSRLRIYIYKKHLRK